MTDALRAILIGAGGIGSAYGDHPSGAPRSHAAGLAARSGVTLVGAVDTASAHRAAFRRARGLPAWSPKQASRAGAIDIAVVATPPDAHSQGLDLAMALGAKAVLMEKPFGRTSAEAAAMAARAAASGTSLLVNYSRRFDPGFGRLRAKVMAGVIGDVRRVRVDYCRGFVNNGSHAIDVALSLVGELTPTAAARRLTGAGADSGLDVWLHSAAGVPVDLCVFPDGRYHTFTVEIVGSEGVARAEGSTAWLQAASGDKLVAARRPVAIVRRLGEGAITEAIDDLVAAARGEGRPRCGAPEALAVWDVMDHVQGLAGRAPTGTP